MVLQPFARCFQIYIAQHSRSESLICFNTLFPKGISAVLCFVCFWLAADTPPLRLSRMSVFGVRVGREVGVGEDVM